METFNIKCYYGNRCVDLALANGTYELQELVDRIVQILDQTGKTFLRSNIVGAIHNNVEIYLQHLLSLKDGDRIVFLIEEPLNDPISPGDESVRARVHEADVGNEGATTVNLPENPPAELIKLKKKTIDIKPQIHEQEEQIQAPRTGDNNNNTDDTARDANKDNQNDGSGSSGESNSSKGESSEEPSDSSSKVVQSMALLLQPFNFTPTSTNLSHSRFVFRGFVTSSIAPAIFKAFGEDEEYHTEVKIYQHLRRAKLENVPKVFNFYDGEDSIHMIMEDLGSEKLEFDTKEETKMFAYDLLQAVDALHKAHVIHADLKPSNLHYDKKQRLVKFFDFSFSSVVPTRNAMGFTHGYASPEARKSRTASQLDDMFSVGMILASCIFSLKVRDDDDYKLVNQKITSGNGTRLADHTIIELISQLICDSNVRWTAEQCLKSECFIDFQSSNSSADEEMKID